MDAVSAVSGVLTLVSFTYECSKVLYSTVESFQTSRKVLRELQAELSALGDVLKSLESSAEANEDSFTALRKPLFQCGSACKEFDVLLKSCTTHSDGPRTSFRDWAKLQYKGKSLSEFKDMLGRYKGTIAIAVGDVNIRMATVTLDVLNDYKRMISETTSDLREALEEINGRLDNAPSGSSIDGSTRQPSHQMVIEEKQTTELCLSICERVAQHIEQAQPQVMAKTSGPHSLTDHSSDQPNAPMLTSQSLRQCGETLDATTAHLRRRLVELNELLSCFSDVSSTEDVGVHCSMLEEKESIERCLAVCSGADRQAQSDRVLVFEDVRLADDGHQIIVSTIGDLISAKRVSAGARSLQWLGQMSDASIQALSQSGRKQAPGVSVGQNVADNPMSSWPPLALHFQMVPASVLPITFLDTPEAWAYRDKVSSHCLAMTCKMLIYSIDQNMTPPKLGDSEASVEDIHPPVRMETTTPTTLFLQQRLLKIAERLTALECTNIQEGASERQELLDEKANVERSLAVRANRQTHPARVMTFEDVKVADKSQQVITADEKALLYAKTVSAGTESFQGLGHVTEGLVNSVSQLCGRDALNAPTRQDHSTVDGYQVRWDRGRELGSNKSI